MTIAIASDDGRGISPHFGRSPYFLVFRQVDGRVEQAEVRQLGAAVGREHHKPGDGEQAAHDHSLFVNLLKDCEAVISRGMGRRAAVELAQYGIKPCVVSAEHTPQQAAEAYFSGFLKEAEGYCGCHD